MAYLNLADPEFNKQISLRDAYRVMVEFIVQYNSRGESSTVALWTDIDSAPDGAPLDPAQLEDYMACVRRVVQDAI